MCLHRRPRPRTTTATGWRRHGGWGHLPPTRLAPSLRAGCWPSRWRRLAVAAVAWFLLSLFQPFKGGEGETVHVVVPKGSSLEQIGELLESRHVVSSSTLLPAPGEDRRAQRRAQAGPLHAPAGHELRRRARRPREGPAAERGAGHDPGGALAGGGGPRGGQAPAREAISRRAGAPGCWTRASTRQRRRRAWRASSSLPPTSCDGANRCAGWWNAS